MNSYIVSCLTVVILSFQVVFGQNVITYHNTIEKIVQEKCLSCHSTNGYAPFKLNTFNDLEKRIDFIKEVITTDYMPPWPADTTYMRYKNEHILTQLEKRLIVDWIDSGYKKGKGPLNEKKQESSLKSFLYIIDTATITLKDSILIKGDNTDRFEILLFKDFEFTRDIDSINIVGFNFVPDNRRLVHHMEVFLIDWEDSINSDRLVDYTAFEYNQFDSKLISLNQLNYLFGWLPGNTTYFYPRNTGMKLPSRLNFMVLIHYSPSPIIEYDFSSIELYYTKHEVNRAVTEIGIHAENILSDDYNIPKDTIITYTNKVLIEEDTEIFAIYPHAHHIATNMEAFIVRAESNDTIPLVRINKWDFNWQFTYEFKEYVTLCAGDYVVYKATYNNTSSNAQNPYNPTRDIPMSFKADDEMMEFFILILN